MRRLPALTILALIGTAIIPAVAHADAVGLQLSPLKYEQTIITSSPQVGVIDVSNPSDAPVDIETSVQGFRQVDTDGNLAYYDSPALSTAIKPDLPNFTLGPREAVRTGFTIDPTKLPQGGVYAVIFFRTLPTDQSSNNSFVAQSAKVGTLLILNNGDNKVVGGKMSLHLPLIELGNKLTGTIVYSVSDSSLGATPKITSRTYLFGRPTKLAAGLVLPGSTRNFELNRPGAYIGLMPITVTDALNGHTTIAWTLACTGWYQTLVALIISIALVGLWRRKYWTRSQNAAPKRSLDGLFKS